MRWRQRWPFIPWLRELSHPRRRPPRRRGQPDRRPAGERQDDPGRAVSLPNATEERPGLYLSTVSEPLEKLIRYGQTLSFFEPEAIGSRVISEGLGHALAKDGLEATVDRVASLLREHRPGLRVIDSFKALETFAENRERYRRAMHELAGYLSAFPASCFWIGEYTKPELNRAPEFAVTDAILSLDTLRQGSREMRLSQVRKLRGSDFRCGQHTYRIRLDGLRFFPRLGVTGEVPNYTPGQERLSSGVAALDAMLDKGTGAVRPPSSSARRDQARHCWDCISSSRAPSAARPASSPRCRRTPSNSSAWHTALAGHWRNRISS